MSKVWYAPHKRDCFGGTEEEAVLACLRDGWLTHGPRTEAFENEVTALFGKKTGVMMNSGSSANLVALCVLDLPAGAEVITPGCTFATCLAPIVQLQLQPVFVDVVPGAYVPKVEDVLAAVTPRTKVILIPDLVGSRLDWGQLRAGITALKRSDIILFQDSCDTIVDTPYSDIAVTSFYPSHIITAGGCGGMVMFNDMRLRSKALMYRDWGRIGNNSEAVEDRFTDTVDGINYDEKFLYGCAGYNFKCSEMNAAFGLAALPRLQPLLKKRRALLTQYVTTLAKAQTRYVLPVDHDKHHWLAMPLMHPGRKQLLPMLEANEVQTRVLFAGNITRHPAFRQFLDETTMPNCDTIMHQGFLLGCHQGMTLDDVTRVSELLITFDRNFEPAVPPQLTGTAPSSDMQLQQERAAAVKGDCELAVKAAKLDVEAVKKTLWEAETKLLRAEAELLQVKTSNAD